MSAPVPTSRTPVAPTSGSQFLALVLRFVFGYGALFACVLLLLRRQPWTFSAVDVVYWFVLVAIVLLDRVTKRGENSEGWRRNATLHFAVGSVAWVMCQMVQAIP